MCAASRLARHFATTSQKIRSLRTDEIPDGPVLVKTQNRWRVSSILPCTWAIKLGERAQRAPAKRVRSLALFRRHTRSDQSPLAWDEPASRRASQHNSDTCLIITHSLP